MSRTAEAVLVLAVAGLASFGVLLVNFAEGRGLDARVGQAFLVFTLVFGSLVAAVRVWAPRSTPLLVPPAATLCAVGFVAIYRLDMRLAYLQGWWMIVSVGVAAMWLHTVRGRGLGTLHRSRYFFLVFAGVLLALPLLPVGGPLPLQGLEVGGQRLWVTWQWGTEIVFQPGEVAKLLLVVFLASYLAEHQTTLTAGGFRLRGGSPLSEPLGPAVVGVAWLVSLFLLLLLGDIGASLFLLGIVVIILYMATNQPSYPLVGSGMFVAGVALISLLLPPLRQRIGVWLDPWTHSEGPGYQLAQGLFAFASGSLSGTGLGLGEPDLVPAATTGFVLATVSEELGLIGAVVVLAAFALLVAIGFGIALRARQLFHKLLAAGLSLGIGVQTILVVAGMTRLLPVTALPTPFMSYGGSSLVPGFLILALLARVSHEERT